MRWLWLFCLLPGLAWAQLPLKDFGRLPVLHEGRVKPVDSFARVLALQVTGSETPDGAAAVQWLLDQLAGQGEPWLRVENAHVRQSLGLGADPRQGLERVAQALDGRAAILRELITTPDAKLSHDQKALLQLAQNVQALGQLRHSFDAFEPLGLSALAAARFGLPGGLYRMGEWEPYLPKLTLQIRDLVQRKGDDPTAYDAAEQEGAALAFTLMQARLRGAQNLLLRVVPEDGEWLSPAQAREGEARNGWVALQQAWKKQDPAAWRKGMHQVQKGVSGKADIRLLGLEWWQNRLDFLAVAVGFYGLAAFLLLLGLRPRFTALLSTGRVSLWLGVASMGTLLALRVLVLARPPVGNLYESILFVAFAVGLLGAWLRRGEAGWMAALAAAGLLILSGFFVPEGDNRPVLVAVLNTNFWLVTHVLCITTGYAVAALAGMLGLVELAAPGVRRFRQLQAMGLVALFFTTVGTILGGIWADQSWGRFWGWDPKENGALLIVLWLIWVQHARLSGQLQARGFAALMALLLVVVALSWFGVNLLGVGLHSYGFTDAAAQGLGGWCALVTLLVAGFYARRIVRERQDG